MNIPLYQEVASNPFGSVGQSPGASVQETASPLGLDEPAPILVWRTGYELRPGILRSEIHNVFTSEESACGYLSRIDLTGYYKRCCPYRLPLEDALRSARAIGGRVLFVRDESARVIEEYLL